MIDFNGNEVTFILILVETDPFVWEAFLGWVL